MTPEEINKMIAEKVMNGEVINHAHGLMLKIGSEVCWWNPCSNIAQAVEALEKFCIGNKIEFQVYKYPKSKYVCMLNIGTAIECESDSLSQAICNALVQVIQEDA